MSKTLIKMYYRMGIYTDEDLDAFVNSRDITAEEKTEILNSQEV